MRLSGTLLVHQSIQTPTRLTICSASMGGKTTFVKRLLENAKGMFTNEFQNIYYHYGSAYQPIFDEMFKRIPHLIFKPGIPKDEELSSIAAEDSRFHNCIILDDLMYEVNNNPKLEKLWTVHSHHYDLTVIYLTKIYSKKVNQLAVLV